MLDVREILNKICLTNSCLSEELLPTREANTSLSKKVDAMQSGSSTMRVRQYT